jgi:hypothetical protein
MVWRSIQIDHPTVRRLVRNGVSGIIEVPSGIELRIARRAPSEMIATGVSNGSRR